MHSTIRSLVVLTIATGSLIVPTDAQIKVTTQTVPVLSLIHI